MILKDRGNGIVECYLYGEISEEGPVSARDVIEQISAIDTVREVNAHIESDGGSITQALAISNFLRYSPFDVNTWVDGIAASAAALLFMSGQRRIMNEHSYLFVHQAWSLSVGTADDHRKTAFVLDMMNADIMSILTANVSVSDEELGRMLRDETWINSVRGLELGFATEVATYEKEGPDVEALNVRQYRNVPQDVLSRYDSRFSKYRQIIDSDN